MYKPLLDTFLDLADIDEVYPSERLVLDYIKRRLKAARCEFRQDKAGNIIATLNKKGDNPLALCGHVDIAAPLNGRRVRLRKDRIETDGKGLLGGDDKTAVASMLTLADDVDAGKIVLTRQVELVFTIGEEAGLMGAGQLDVGLLKSNNALVFDWLGAVNRIISSSPAYYKVDVTYHGKDAHPAEWQKGKNAGAALMKAAAALRQGDYSADVIFNIGVVQAGSARNKVAGLATLQAEVRGYDTDKVAHAAKQVATHFRTVAKRHKMKATVTANESSGAYKLNTSSPLLNEVTEVLQNLKLKPLIEDTYGCFDANVLSTKGLDTIIMGAAFHNPHNPDEYVDTNELMTMYDFIKSILSN